MSADTRYQVIVQEQVTLVSVDEGTRNVDLVVELWGPQGPAGPPRRRFSYSQPTPSAEWVIDHDLDGQPVVTIVDTAGTTVYGDVTYVDNTRVVVSFSAPFAGTANLV
jgi:hypothetical protein